MNARLGEHYELIDRFATGGVAELYRARDVRDGKIVVIKRMRADADFDPEQSAGFLRELQLALMCKHKNLIEGYAKGTAQDGSDYGVLEYVDGQDLHAILARARKTNVAIPASFATYIVGEILDGLEFAWTLKDGRGRQLGLVHRDLAPKNVFVRYDGQVRIGDFGSSCAALQEPTPQEVVGTPGYMSPEQASRQKLDQRSDVFAAGCIFFELLAGKGAFDLDKKNDAAILKMHQKAQRRPIPPTVPEDLAMIIDIATAASPEDRYQSAKDMLRGLKRTDTPPDASTALGIATIVRRMFADEFKNSRIPGATLPF
jgi:eukaryotic-like serine/threonine-protein kinase